MSQIALAENTPPEYFKCHSLNFGEYLNIKFSGASYGDEINLKYILKDRLLTQDELKLNPQMDYLTMWAKVGTCERGTGNVLLSCVSNEYGIGQYGFTYGKEISTHWYESREVIKDLKVHKMALKIVKKTVWDEYLKKDKDVAVMILDMNADLLQENNVNLHIEEELETLSPEFMDNCEFVKGG